MKSPKFHPTFKISYDIRQANKLLIHNYFEEVSKLWYCPSLRDFKYTPREITPSYSLHTRAFGTYLLEGLFTLQKRL
jgi:hypothetical protein